ncbi:putative outer membrane starch-binding protein [Pontibacter ummariensis]|uniref:Starch-binding associating with outer membrane n=1 Tax=Pontibacter ummariensis TaxID=1610492 RepID=A0A239G3N3_9BACT|nr:RagB/SusD family nutrient uptake outer membrane protein [Pontibacter ummariensis]PRY11668.1 putative outer membrane starch-binding protein [Pontibacter ummariensis]SNS63318.1 Starch-binding associating with outer membrane [Pontibacter ummariensis]
MKNKYKLLGASLLMLFAAPACTDLEEEAYDVLPAGNYYQDSNSIIAAVTRPYEHGHWNGWDGDRWLLSELTADQFVWAQKGRHGQDGGNWVRLHRHEWTADDGRVNGGWVGPYQGIGQCNLIIEDLSKLDYAKMGLTEADQKRHINELRVLRAWFYTFLIDFFRSVPIVTVSGERKANSSPEEVFAFIETELKEALPNLPKNTRPGRWDQAGAAALLMRIYLNSEAWTGTPRYSDCASIAQKIIDGEYGAYSIDPDYRGPFKSGVNGVWSPENIFEFPHARNIYEFGWMYNAMQHYQARYSLENTSGGWNGITLSPSRDLEGNIYDYELGNPYETYSDDDKRKQPFRTTAAGGEYEGFFLIGPQFEFNHQNQYGFDSTKAVLGTEEYIGKPLVYVDQVGRFTEGAAGLAKGSHVETGEENSGVRFLKFPWLPQSQGMFHFNSAPEIRLAEVYYALAECKYRAGDKAAAAELLDAVRRRNFSEEDWAANSYVNNLGRLTDDEFVDELGREFLGERHRRTDLVRWGRFGDAWWDKSADAADKTVFPIPANALNSNPLLKPNGY